jgi:dihydrofolate synthase / folylpolyglutamate synthase
MNFLPIKTRVFRIPRDDIYKLLDESVTDLRNSDLLCITTKILAIAQGRCVKMDESIAKHHLIKQEADYFLPKTVKVGKRKVMLTIKDSTLIPSAGIDESNGNGYYVLWPKNTNRFLREIWLYLKTKHRIKTLGVIATDSHTVPLRRGVVGISTGFFGFSPLRDHRGKKDIFGRKLKMTRSNIADAVAAAAVVLMGEGRERIPFVICRNVEKVNFNAKKNNYRQFIINKKEDIYRPILKGFKHA